MSLTELFSGCLSGRVHLVQTQTSKHTLVRLIGVCFSVPVMDWGVAQRAAAAVFGPEDGVRRRGGLRSQQCPAGLIGADYCRLG